MCIRTIKLTKGYVAVVDSTDYELVSKYKWFAQVSKRVDGSVRIYAMRNIIIEDTGKRTKQLLHRLIMNTPYGMETDHIDGNTLDNRRVNLRICTKSDNLHNQTIRSGGSSKYKGVYWNKNRNNWKAQIGINGTRKLIGYFVSETDAAFAYNRAAVITYGEFARLNQL